MILQFSCIDPINLTLEDKEEFLVVDGSFSADTGPHRLKLYFATGQRVKAQRPVSNAAITLFEESAVFGQYTETSPGNYELGNGSVAGGSVGKSYHINIELENGASFQSQPDILPQRIQGDSVFFTYAYKDEPTPAGLVRRPYVDVFTATPLPEQGSDYWLKWVVNTMYSFPEVVCSPLGPPPDICYIRVDDDQQEIQLLDGNNVNASYLPEWKVGEKILPPSDFEYRGKHYFLVNQQSITKDAYDYWRKINLIANQSGSIFDAPPAAVPGNVYNINDPNQVVLGYFELSNTDSLRGFITEGDFFDFYKFTSNVCEDAGNPFAQNQRACCFCTIIDNGTTIRPEWW